jgi:hypothetical protein
MIGTKLTVSDFALCVLTCAAVTLATPAVGQTLDKVVVRGTSVQVFGQHPGEIIVVVGDRVVIHDDHDMTVSIQGIYEGEGRTYVLVEENSGGNGCPGLFQAIDLTSTIGPQVSKPFGTCSDLPKASVQSGNLQVTLPRMDGKGNITYSYFDGKLETHEQAVSLEPSGPEAAPGGDLAAFAIRRRIDQLFRLRASAASLMRIMPPAAFNEARDLALSGPSSEAVVRGDDVYLGACEAHNCGWHQVTIAFDHVGHAWAALLNDAKITFYGNPPENIRIWLDPRQH